MDVADYLWAAISELNLINIFFDTFLKAVDFDY